MQNEYERILRLLQEKKISKEEFQLLTNALQRKDNPFIIWLQILVNPYQYIGQTICLVIGICALPLLALFANYLKLHFPSVIVISLVREHQHVLFSTILFEMVLSWLMISGLFFIYSLIIKVKNIKLYDCVSYIALAIIPDFLVLLTVFICYKIDPNIIYLNTQNTHSLKLGFENAIFTLLFFAFISWRMILLFNAFKAAIAIDGYKLWIGFMSSLIISEVVMFIIIPHLVV